MITKIDLPENFKLTKTEQSNIIDFVKKEFPSPLAKSINNFLMHAQEEEEELAITNFARDFVTSLFHYLALLMVSEYINSRIKRDYKIYQAIENMTYRPGPGKWLGFLRELHNYYNSDDIRFKSRFEDIIEFLDFYEISKKRPRIKIEENYGQSTSKKLGVLEFLVKFRNNFAHTKTLDKELVHILFQQVLELMLFLCRTLQFLSKYNIFFIEKPDLNTKGIDFSLDILEENNGKLIVNVSEIEMPLYPLLITEKILKSKSVDMFLLEELDSKRAFFSSSNSMIEKRKGKHEIFEKILQLLKTVEAEPEKLGVNDITWDRFSNRCKAFSAHTVNEYVENMKYNEELYVYPGKYENTINDFKKSGKSVMFIGGDQGVGKSALIAYLTNNILKSDLNNECVIFIDARNLGSYGNIPDLFDRYLKENLKLEAGMKDILHILRKQSGKTIYFLIDNLNEYFSEKIDQSFIIDRIIELLTIISFDPKVKLIATSRPVMYKNSFKSYSEKFKSGCNDNTFMPQDKITVTLEELTKNELERIFENYSNKLIGFSPNTSWNELEEKTKEACRNPLLMQFLLRYFDGKKIPSGVTDKKIKQLFTNLILYDKNQLDIIHLLLARMNKLNQPYILSYQLDEKESKFIFNTELNPKTGNSWNSPYNYMLSFNIIREEIYKENDNIGKKISFTNEMVNEILDKEHEEIEKKKSRKFNKILMLVFLLFVDVFFVLASISYYKSLNNFSFSYSSLLITLVNDAEMNIDHLTGAINDLMSIPSNNSFFKTIIPIGILIHIFAVVLLIFRYSDKMVDLLVKKKEKFNNIYDKFFFKKEQLKKSITVRRKLILVCVIIFGLPLIGFFVNTFLEIIEIKDAFLFMFFCIGIIVLFFYGTYVVIKVEVKYLKQNTEKDKYLLLKHGFFNEVNILKIKLNAIIFFMYLILIPGIIFINFSIIGRAVNNRIDNYNFERANRQIEYIINNTSEQEQAKIYDIANKMQSKMDSSGYPQTYTFLLKGFEGNFKIDHLTMLEPIGQKEVKDYFKNNYLFILIIIFSLSFIFYLLILPVKYYKSKMEKELLRDQTLKV